MQRYSHLPGGDKLLKRINGALRNTIHSHGPITEQLIGSASKRIMSTFRQWNRDVARHHESKIQNQEK